MSTSTLAIPSALPGGLEAGMGMHFGHCDIYTIVQIEDGAIKSVGTSLPCFAHRQFDYTGSGEIRQSLSGQGCFGGLYLQASML